MALTAEQALAMSKSYTAKTLKGAGAIKGDKGDTGATGADGISPTVSENTSNTPDDYRLDITDAIGSFTTPNLKGAKGDKGDKGDSGADGVIFPTIDLSEPSELDAIPINDYRVYVVTGGANAFVNIDDTVQIHKTSDTEIFLTTIGGAIIHYTKIDNVDGTGTIWDSSLDFFVAVSDMRSVLGNLQFSVNNTALTITDGTNTWTLNAD